MQSGSSPKTVPFLHEHAPEPSVFVWCLKRDHSECDCGEPECVAGKALEGARMLEQRPNISSGEMSLCCDLFLELAFTQRNEDAVKYLGMALDMHKRIDTHLQVHGCILPLPCVSFLGDTLTSIPLSGS